MDLVTFGEAMVRLTPPNCQRLEQARSLDVYVGGGELNVAVGAARLGLGTSWVSRLSDNQLGRMIANRAREQGVDTGHVLWTRDDRAGLYFAELGAAPRASSVLYDRANSAIAGVAPGMVDWKRAFKGTRWFHTSGITPALSDSAAATVSEALGAAKSAGLTVSYDLNFRSKLWSADKARAVQEPLMQHVDILIVTEEDARVVFGITSGKAANMQRSTPSRTSTSRGSCRTNSTSASSLSLCARIRACGRTHGAHSFSPKEKCIALRRTKSRSWIASEQATHSPLV